MSALFELANLDVNYRKVQALSGVNLTISAGESVALVGANGSGKSTLLRLLHGLVSPTAGQCVRDATATQAMLFQHPFMLRTSAQNNVALGLWLRGARWSAARVQALEALARVGLAPLAARQARTLSGGQQQRLALARAWGLKPDVLLLDEPTASLDPHAKREVEQLIAEFTQRPVIGAVPAKPMTLIFASHNLGQVKRLASRVVYLEGGHVLADLPVKAFFDHDHLRSVSEAADMFVRGESV
jgi:tungstate transport system ATP-binding protein